MPRARNDPPEESEQPAYRGRGGGNRRERFRRPQGRDQGFLVGSWQVGERDSHPLLRPEQQRTQAQGTGSVAFRDRRSGSAPGWQRYASLHREAHRAHRGQGASRRSGARPDSRGRRQPRPLHTAWTAAEGSQKRHRCGIGRGCESRVGYATNNKGEFRNGLALLLWLK